MALVLVLGTAGVPYVGEIQPQGSSPQRQKDRRGRVDVLAPGLCGPTESDVGPIAGLAARPVQCGLVRLGRGFGERG